MIKITKPDSPASFLPCSGSIFPNIKRISIIASIFHNFRFTFHDCAIILPASKREGLVDLHLRLIPFSSNRGNFDYSFNVGDIFKGEMVDLTGRAAKAFLRDLRG